MAKHPWSLLPTILHGARHGAEPHGTHRLTLSIHPNKQPSLLHTQATKAARPQTKPLHTSQF